MPALPTSSDLPLEEDFKSSDDEDFNPDASRAPASDEESSEDETHDVSTGAKKPKKRKQGAAEDDNDDADFANSGDEATIRKGQKRLKKRGADGDEEEEEEEEGGEGGLIKTRAQRAKEGKEKRPLANAADATVDVDALWATMQSSKPVQQTEQKSNGAEAVEPPAVGPDTTTQHGIEMEKKSETPSHAMRNEAASGKEKPTQASNNEDMIIIKRTYDFAGDTITEEKTVPKASAEAALFLQSQNQPTPPTDRPAVRRPKKRPSMFDSKGAAGAPSALTGASKAPKLNTIEKSKLDWAGFVDKEGIADELDEHSRAKEGYLGRMDFLGRVEAKREEELKSARNK